MRISDWSSDVCSSDLTGADIGAERRTDAAQRRGGGSQAFDEAHAGGGEAERQQEETGHVDEEIVGDARACEVGYCFAIEGDAEGAMRNNPIGRSSGRERVCQKGKITGVDVSIKKK